jgi:hypothetical protein
MVLVFYISSHGFGHATRSLELINTIVRKQPEIQIVIRSGVAASFVGGAALTPMDLQFADTDTGVVQVDSLAPDEAATAQRAAAFYTGFERRVEAEAAVLRDLRATLVVADIPPLAFAAAARAGVRSVAVANFTWDWIYEAYPAIATLAPQVLPAMRAAYADTSLALRLPLHGGFEPMRAVIEEIPIIARHSQLGKAEARRILGLIPEQRVVLASFGAYGAHLPYAEIARDHDFTLIVTEHESPASASANGEGRLMRIAEADLAARGLRYPDLVAAADVVVTKPGYGIVSECIANGPALLYTSRGRFPEYDIFVEQMPALHPCRFISQDDLRAGRWADGIEALLRQPVPSAEVKTNGADVAAERILAEADA